MKRSVRDETKSCLDVTIRITLTPDEFRALSEEQITAFLKALADLNNATVPLRDGEARRSVSIIDTDAVPRGRPPKPRATNGEEPRAGAEVRDA